MKITYSQVDADSREAIASDFNRYVGKLERLLSRYNSDAVHLHNSVEKAPRKVEFSFAMNLKLPTGTLHATGKGPDVRSSSKAAFAELEGQIKKHQQKVRKDYVWKRKRGRAVASPKTAVE